MSSNQQISDYIYYYPQVLDSNICNNIVNYFDKNDSQSLHLKIMLTNLGYEGVLEKICGLNKKYPLNQLCIKQNLKSLL